MLTRFRVLVALLPILFLPLGSALLRADGGSHATVTVDGHTIEVNAPSGSVATRSSDHAVSIRSGDGVVRWDGARLILAGKSCELSAFQRLTVTLEGGTAKVMIDGKELDLRAQGRPCDDLNETNAEESFAVPEVKGLALEGLNESFRVEVDPKAQAVTVTRAGCKIDLPAVEVAKDGATIRIRGKGPFQPRVTVKTPPGVAVRVSDCGDGKVGDLQADFSLKATGTADYEVGKVRSADATLSGSGDLVIDAVDGGKLSVVLSGSGNVKVGSVHGGDLKVLIRGSADVEIGGGDAKLADLEIAGSGDVHCAARCAQARLRITGSGDIRMPKPGEVLEKTVTGSGDVELGGE